MRESTAETKEVIEKVIRIDRVTKVVKGGKKLGFRAFVIIGNQHGEAGCGSGKSKEVPIAIKKAIQDAKKNKFTVKIKQGTIPHQIIGKRGASRVMINPAKPGTGVIAGGALRILFEALGIKDIVAKSYGARNAINMTKAAIEGLLNCKDIEVEEKKLLKKLPIYQTRGDDE